MPIRQSPVLVQPIFTPLTGAHPGVLGPYGEVQVFKLRKEWIPVRVATNDRSASADFTGRASVVRFGNRANAIRLSPEGVRFGDERTLSWTGPTVQRVIDALSDDAVLTSAAMRLRATLLTSYPVAVARQQDGPASRRMSRAMGSTSAALGQRAMFCRSTETIQEVTREVTTIIETVLTAHEQYVRCYDRQAGQLPCSAFPPGAGLCAAGLCAVEQFFDIVTGFLEIVGIITEYVVRQVLVCAPVRIEGYGNPWAVLPSNDLLRGVAQPRTAFTPKQIDEAAKLVKSFAGFLGPFGTCLVDGKWSLAQLETPLDVGAGPLVLPYGVKVCIRAECAKRLRIESMLAETAASWGSALAALAALSPAFAAATSIAPSAVVAAAVAAASPAVVAAAALVLGFIILALIYATLIAAQLTFHGIFTSAFDDGLVCIEHPSFALALIKLASLTLVPSELVPPIVTG